MTTTTDQLANKLLEIINQVQTTVTNHSADALNMVLLSVQVDGIIKLILVFSVIFILLYIAHQINKYGKKLKLENYGKYKIQEEDIIISSGIFIITPALIFIIFTIISPWTYVQAFSPKFYLTHEIINKVMQ